MHKSSLATACSKCGRVIPPDKLDRIDFQKVEFPQRASGSPRKTWGIEWKPCRADPGSMSSIKRVVKKKVRPRPEVEKILGLEIRAIALRVD